MWGGHPHPLEQSLVARTIAERYETGIDAEKNARAEVLIDHPFSVVHRFIELVEMTMNDRAREVDDRRGRRRLCFHQFQALAPVAFRASLTESTEESGTIEWKAPAWLQFDDCCSFLISSERLVCRTQDVPRLFEPRKDFARL
jgi:hypothetical protein